MRNRGFGIIEMIVAMGIFVIIAATGVITVLSGLSSNRLADEETEAAIYASSGIEAIRYLRDLDYSNLVNGNYGLDDSSGQWVLSGSNDSQGKFNREIIIEDVYRNNGEIVEAGGELDSDTKKVTSHVWWNFSLGRDNELTLVEYLTNWRGNHISYDTCSGYCIALEFESGECRSDANRCTGQGESYESEGDQFCKDGGPSEDKCCCFGTYTPTIDTCSEYCSDNGYEGGNCRQNTQACDRNGETYEVDGDQYCKNGVNVDTCCCFGVSVTPTPNPSGTPIPTPTFTPAPINTCIDYCVSLGNYSTGICRQNSVQCGKNGETYEGEGDQYCVGGAEVDTCCCGQ